MVAGHRRVEVVLQVVRQLQEQRGMIRPRSVLGLRQRRVAVVVVRQVDRQQRIDPTADERQERVDQAAPASVARARRTAG